MLRIRNTGNQPIKAEDFNRPISFEFEEGAEIFNAQIIDSNPDNLKIGFSIIENVLSFDKELLNSKDSIDISLIATTEKQPTVDARIVGIKKIKLKELSSSPSLTDLATAIIEKVAVNYIFAFLLIIFMTITAIQIFAS